jgi:hypothetical protein
VAPSGSPFVQATTDTAGNFTLTNVPAPTANSGLITLVIQKGRWRKVIQIKPTSCGSLALTKAQSSFGTTQSDTAGTHIPSNNIPKFAVTSGGADAMQCLLRRMGVANSEFTNPNGTGRINLYHGATNNTTATTKYNTALGGATFPNETTLYGSSTTTDDSTLLKYDGVILTCIGVSDSNGSPYANYTDDMKAYADAGGKIFASHWHHAWVHHGPSPWPTVATFNDGANQDDAAVTATVNQTLQFGKDLTSWLKNAGDAASPNFQVTGARRTVQSVSIARDLADVPAGSYTDKNGTHTLPAGVQYSDFLTPVGNATQCGRFVLSDLHVSAASGDRVDDGPNGTGFPDNCASTTTLSDQEKVLAFMIFDLTSCIGNTPPPATCTPLDCNSAVNKNKCGKQSDGCGGLTAQSCATCTAGQSCGAGGPGICGPSTCTPKTCTTGCGSIPDGCGGLATCPACTGTDTCGGGGTAGVCGHPSCTKLSCSAQGIDCGQAGDGCGGVQDCPPCAAGLTCGGGGTPNKCGKPACTPITTCPNGKNCGDIPDGCGGKVHCGDCDASHTCGANDNPNVCGTGTCTAKSCADLGAQCGQVADGCGNVTACPACPAGDFCNATNVCVAPTCTPKTCADIKATNPNTCGIQADGCGGLTQDCGQCGPGQACGVTSPSTCGTAPCHPQTCADIGAVCGQVADGCGGLTPSCGACAGTTSCTNGACVVACTPTTCAAAGAQCGFISDGCGNALDCGSCAAGYTCGFNNVANTCGSDGPK